MFGLKVTKERGFDVEAYLLWLQSEKNPLKFMSATA